MKSVQYRFGEFRLISATRQVWRNGTPVRLPRRVFDCIVYLLENRDRAIGRDELVAALWGRVDVADTQLSQLMRRVRHALGDDGQSQQTIETVQGFGYRWAMSAEAEPAPAGDDPDPAAGATQPASHAASVASGSVVSQPVVPPEPAPGIAPGEPRGRNWLAYVAAAGVVVIAIVLLVAWRGAAVVPDGQPSAPENERLVVLPVDVTGPSESAWVRLGAMDVVADRLRASGLVVPPSESVVATLHEAGAGDPGDRVFDLFEAGILVYGQAVKSPGGWRITLETRSSRDEVKRVAEASDPDPVQAAHAAADRLAAALGYAVASDPGERETFDGRIARVRAALLANEVDVARRLLDIDDLAGENSIAIRYWRAKTDFLAGDLDSAQAAFDALLAEDEVRADQRMHGRVLIARAGVHIRRADYAAADGDFDAAIADLREFEASAEYAEALAGRGIARVALERFDEAAADLGQARVQMELAGDPFGATRVDANLGLFELVRRRPAAALPYLQDAAERFEAFGAIGALLSTLNAQFDAYAYLLRWREALAVSERRTALGNRAVDPMQRYLIGVDRSRVLTALGRYREANRVLDAVEVAFPDMRGNLQQVLHAQRADLAWREGDVARALVAARQGLDDAPCVDTSTPCGTLLLVYQRALIANGTAGTGPVAPAIAMLAEPDAEVLASPVAEVAQAEWSTVRGDEAASETHYARALAEVERNGAPRDIALVADSHARWLVRRGRFDEAASVAGRVTAWAGQDYDCALLQVVVLQAYGRAEPWAAALERARLLAGERAIPEALALPPG